MCKTKLTTESAVIHVLVNAMANSKYHLATMLQIRPIMISNYLHKGTRMGRTTADKFEALYDIEITDVYDPRSKIE